MAIKRGRSWRWLFWVYAVLAFPTLLAIFVFRVEGDTNTLFWITGILMMVLSLPWILFPVGFANLPLVGGAIILNGALLWWLTRPRSAAIPAPTNGAPGP